MYCDLCVVAAAAAVVSWQHTEKYVTAIQHKEAESSQESTQVQTK